MSKVSKDKGPARLKVRATRQGYYADGRRRPGDVFFLESREVIAREPKTGRPLVDKATGKFQMRLLTAEEQFSEHWMERVPPSTALHHSTSRTALAEAQQKIRDRQGGQADEETPTGDEVI